MKCQYCNKDIPGEEVYGVCEFCTIRLVKYVGELEKRFKMTIKNKQDYIAARMMERTQEERTPGTQS